VRDRAWIAIDYLYEVAYWLSNDMKIIGLG